MEKQPAVYIVSNARRTVLYTGVTSQLAQRVYQHKSGTIEGFTKRYQCRDLLWFEQYERMADAIHREKQIKRFRREKKEALINTINPEWDDLYEQILP